MILDEQSETATILTDLRTRLSADSVGLAKEGMAELSQLSMEGKWDAVIEAIKGTPKTEKERNLLAWAYIMQGTALSDLAELKQDEAVFEASFEKLRRL